MKQLRLYAIIALMLVTCQSYAQDFKLLPDTSFISRKRWFISDSLPPRDSTAFYKQKCDSLQEKLQYYVFLHKFTKQRVLKAGKICVHNPKQLVNLIGWINAAFD